MADHSLNPDWLYREIRRLLAERDNARVETERQMRLRDQWGDIIRDACDAAEVPPVGDSFRALPEAVRKLKVERDAARVEVERLTRQREYAAMRDAKNRAQNLHDKAEAEAERLERERDAFSTALERTAAALGAWSDAVRNRDSDTAHRHEEVIRDLVSKSAAAKLSYVRGDVWWLRGVASGLREEVDRAQEERDAARAEVERLTAELDAVRETLQEHDDDMRHGDETDSAAPVVGGVVRERNALRAEVERMRPAVEATGKFLSQYLAAPVTVDYDDLLALRVAYRKTTETQPDPAARTCETCAHNDTPAAELPCRCCLHNPHCFGRGDDRWQPRPSTGEQPEPAPKPPGSFVATLSERMRPIFEAAERVGAQPDKPPDPARKCPGCAGTGLCGFGQPGHGACPTCNGTGTQTEPEPAARTCETCYYSDPSTGEPAAELCGRCRKAGELLFYQSRPKTEPPGLREAAQAMLDAVLESGPVAWASTGDIVGAADWESRHEPTWRKLREVLESEPAPEPAPEPPGLRGAVERANAHAHEFGACYDKPDSMVWISLEHWEPVRAALIEAALAAAKEADHG